MTSNGFQWGHTGSKAENRGYHSRRVECPTLKYGAEGHRG